MLVEGLASISSVRMDVWGTVSTRAVSYWLRGFPLDRDVQMQILRSKGRQDPTNLGALFPNQPLQVGREVHIPFLDLNVHPEYHRLYVRVVAEGKQTRLERGERFSRPLPQLELGSVLAITRSV